MSDSTENTNNLDSYGVWVKRPPQDAPETTEEVQNDTVTPDEVSIDEPVISDDLSFDTMADNDTTLSDEELSNITSDIEMPEEDAPVTTDDSLDDMFDIPEFADENSEGTESAAEAQAEPALSDDFAIPEETELSDEAAVSEDEPVITEDEPVITEETFEAAPTPETESDSEPAAIEESTEFSADDFMNDTSDITSTQEDGEISLDDFMDGDFSDSGDSAPAGDGTSDEISIDDFFDDDSSASAKEDDVSNDEPLDIDLSFTENSENEVPVEDTIETEEADIDTSEDDMFDSLESGASDMEASADSLDMSSTEEVSLDDFGIDENSDDATAVAAGAAINAQADSENVDLSDFGIDSDDAETPVKQDVQAAKKNQKVDYDLAITDDDETVAAPTIGEVPSTEHTEKTAPAAETATAKVDTSVLDMIMQELSGLKNEINSLRDEFQDLKSHEIQPAASEQILPEKEEATGFFDGDDEDETIALSGDELSNIMNTAAITEEEAPVETEDDLDLPSENTDDETIPAELPDELSSHFEEDPFKDSPDDSFSLTEDEDINDVFTEEPDSGLSMELNEDSLVEPNLEEINSKTEEDVQLPKVDDLAPETETENNDILVESSQSDLIGSVKEAETEIPLQGEESFDSVQEVSEAENDDEIPTVDSIIAESESTETTESGDPIFDSYMKEEPSVSESLSEESIDYLKDDVTSENAETAEAENDTGITFGEETAEEVSENTAEETEAPSDESSLPDDLKNDVKSVLLYMDQLLENLPEDKIMEFAKSEQFATYKKLFNELGIS